MAMKLLLTICLTNTIILPTIFCYKECLKPGGMAVSDAFLDSKEFFIPIHSDCDNCEKGDHKWSAIGGRTANLVKRTCWTMIGERSDGTEFAFPFDCKHATYSELTCELKTKTPPFYSGNIIFTRTDNSTYIAGATCIFGKENFWWVASTTETIGDKLMAEIKEDFAKKGFKIDNIAIAGKNEVTFNKMNSKPGKCE